MMNINSEDIEIVPDFQPIMIIYMLRLLYPTLGMSEKIWTQK